jgi:hypothetical protein
VEITEHPRSENNNANVNLVSRSAGPGPGVGTEFSLQEAGQDRRLAGIGWSCELNSAAAWAILHAMHVVAVCCMHVLCASAMVGWSKPAVGRKIPSLNWLDP